MHEKAFDLYEKGGCMKIIIEKARANGLVNHNELLECLSSTGVTDSDQIDDIIEIIKDMGFSVTYS